MCIPPSSRFPFDSSGFFFFLPSAFLFIYLFLFFSFLPFSPIRDTTNKKHPCPLDSFSSRSSTQQKKKKKKKIEKAKNVKMLRESGIIVLYIDQVVLTGYIDGGVTDPSLPPLTCSNRNFFISSVDIWLLVTMKTLLNKTRSILCTCFITEKEQEKFQSMRFSFGFFFVLFFT